MADAIPASGNTEAKQEAPKVAPEQTQPEAPKAKTKKAVVKTTGGAVRKDN